MIQGDSILLGKMGKRILKISNIRKTLHYLKKNGVKHAYYAARERIEEERKTQYIYMKPAQNVLAVQREEAKQFPYKLSLVVPAYETKEEFLRELVESVLRQSFENWELVIADASSSDTVEKIAAEYIEKERVQKTEEHGRIRYMRLTENNGISANTNAGIETATGDYIGLLDHDDFLAPDALYEIAKAIQEAEKAEKEPILLYSDEDKYENNACYYIQPNRKYKFNLDLILSNNYICHLMFIKADVIKTLRLRKEYDGAQDYDLVLRVIGKLLENTKAVDLEMKIIHIPKVLYHWRCHEASTAENTASKSYAYEAGKAALEDFCIQRGWKTEINHSLHLGFYEMIYHPDIFAERPEVGVIGGRILDKDNKITSGIYDKEGNKLYQGVHKEYSGGSTHRAVLKQDCTAVDIRCMRVCKSLQPVFEQIMGVSYQEIGKQKLVDVSGISCDEEGYRKLSMEFGRAVRKAGYLVVWDPKITTKVKN